MTLPKAITFDFWETLVSAPSAPEVVVARRNRLFDLLNERADGPDHGRLGAALTEVREEFNRHWAANEQFSGFDAVAMLLDVLHLDGSDEWRARVVGAFVDADGSDIPPLTDNIEQVLRSLEARDVRIGIICDVGLTPSPVLRSFLDHHGVLDAFDHWSFSDEVGVYKPHPKIFEHALAGLGGIAPSDAAHVGDLRRTDVAGAIAMGMTAVRYAGCNDDVLPAGEGDASMGPSSQSVERSEADAPEAHHVITDHLDLLTVLGFES